MATDLFRVSLLLYSDTFASFISHCRKSTLYSAGPWWKSLSSIVFCGDIIWRRKNLHKTLRVAYISLTRCYISVIKSLIAAYNVTMAKMTASYRGRCVYLERWPCTAYNNHQHYHYRELLQRLPWLLCRPIAMKTI